MRGLGCDAENGVISDALGKGGVRRVELGREVFGDEWRRGDIYFPRRVNDDNGNKEKRRRERRAN